MKPMNLFSELAAASGLPQAALTATARSLRNAGLIGHDTKRTPSEMDADEAAFLKAAIASGARPADAAVPAGALAAMPLMCAQRPYRYAAQLRRSYIDFLDLSFPHSFADGLKTVLLAEAGEHAIALGITDKSPGPMAKEVMPFITVFMTPDKTGGCAVIRIRSPHGFIVRNFYSSLPVRPVPFLKEDKDIIDYVDDIEALSGMLAKPMDLLTATILQRHHLRAAAGSLVMTSARVQRPAEADRAAAGA